MEDPKYSVGYFAGGTLTVGVVLLASGVILIIAAALMAVVCESGAVGMFRYWYVLLLAGFVAIVPGIMFLFISRHLRKM